MPLALNFNNYGTTFNIVLLVVRLFLGLMIFSHGYRKVFKGGKIAGTAGWFDSIGMKPGKLNAWAAASTEIGVGILLVLGLLTTLAAAGLVALMVVAIITVHGRNGFFVTNPGGGYEYCLAIAVASLVPGALGAGRYSLDDAWHVFSHWSHTTGLLVTVVLGVGGALLQVGAFYRPPKKA